MQRLPADDIELASTRLINQLHPKPAEQNSNDIQRHENNPFVS
jgi:hypothetical protein